ncbi:MAG: M48 family metalloprotease [Haliscomenobacter sp.]|uniref:M48 family metalloprotease n=1 Tax=Haliscomenobacter sp. TaxID=2717303 RepID=UPI0029B41104|nr:M48 family metalloprotease [Haliscomenobacter sp.]MDX2069768.1 M48 family metalloprotease [Haliscomenobacter sp.]
MEVKQVSISADFKNNLTKAIFSIVLFIIVYLILFLTGSLISLFAISLGGIIILDNLGLFGILLGLGVIGMGVMVFIFLIKFIFRRNIIDRSHLIEIKAADEPRLFALLQEIVEETQTQFPKKVYLSSNVNAGVFYNSSFWSMFFPVRKNLEIGLGLVNGVSKAELKAILAHEFGHFSQGSMKVGSYVYQVNQVLYNLLFENKTFNLWLQRWSSISGYFWIFVWLGLQFIRFTQWILGKIYNLVNVSYMGLSRAMEFHADEVAARVTGSAPMITGLSRIDFIDAVFNDVLDQYTRKIPNSIKTQNVYPQHRFVMQFLAKRYEYPIQNGLPQIDLGNNRYNKSKLVINDQWASHPSTPDRVKALQVLNIPASALEEQPADQLFDQLPKWQIQLTQMLFKPVEYQTPPQDEDLSSFQEAYSANYEKSSFSSFYNGYYDQHNPISHMPDELLASVGHTELAPAGTALFDPSAIDLMYGFHGLENDLAWLESIQKGTYVVKTLDYAGKKYRLKEIPKLIPRLQQELETAKAKIKTHDLAIFRYFYTLAQKASRTETLVQHYKTFIEYDRAYPEKQQLAQEIRNLLTFTEEKLPVKTIEGNLAVLQGWEEKLKVAIRHILDEPIYQAALVPEMRKHLSVYCGKQWQYFNQTAYNDDALNVLFSSISGYETVLQDTYFKLKKDLLNLQVELEENKDK